MKNEEIQKNAHLRTLRRALDNAHQLLTQTEMKADNDEVHRIKSVLYVAIEQMSMKAEKLFYSHRLLRELFSIVTMKGDIKEHERLAGLQILQELDERCQKEIEELRQKEEEANSK